jgi:hypothetical protein
MYFKILALQKTIIDKIGLGPSLSVVVISDLEASAMTAAFQP